MKNLDIFINNINLSLKKGILFCDVPKNKLNFQLLNLFVQNGYISAFVNHSNFKYRVCFCQYNGVYPFIKLKKVSSSFLKLYNIRGFASFKQKDYNMYVVTNSRGFSFVTLNLDRYEGLVFLEIVNYFK